jgi:hypothetical protein
MQQFKQAALLLKEELDDRQLMLLLAKVYSRRAKLTYKKTTISQVMLAISIQCMRAKTTIIIKFSI